MPWKTPYSKGKFKELPIELKKFWIEVLNYSMDDIMENIVETIPLHFRNLHSTEKQFLFEYTIDTLFGNELLHDENAFVDMAAVTPFIMFQTYIDNDELSLSTLFSWIKMLILAWESLNITPDDNDLFDFYPLFRKRIILKILKNTEHLTDYDQIRLMDVLEQHKDCIKEHLSNYLDDIRDSLFWSEDWVIETGWTLSGKDLKQFQKQYDIVDFYYEKFFLFDGNNLYIVCPCHKTKKRMYYPQLHNKFTKIEMEMLKYDRKKDRKILLEKFAENYAALFIQKQCHNWLWSPRCKDGSPGINLRLGWKSIEESYISKKE